MTAATGIFIRDPFAFNSTERHAYSRAVATMYGVNVTSWYVDWMDNNTIPVAKIIVECTPAKAKIIATSILTAMHASINSHYDPKSFNRPVLLVIDNGDYSVSMATGLPY